MLRTLPLLALLAVVGCGGPRTPTDTQVSPVSTVDAATLPPIDVVTCLSAADCGAGQDCIGPAGCGVPWTCQPQRPCTRDAVEYCTCDGRTVTGSSRCPPSPYKHRGPCN